MSSALEENVKLAPAGPSASLKEPDCLNSTENTLTDWKIADVRAVDFCAEVLPASYHQGSSKFGVLAGTQCGSIIATAAVMKKHKSKDIWTTVGLDNVLSIGTYYHSKNQTRDASNFVDVNDCHGVYKLDGDSFDFMAKDFGVARTSSDNEFVYFMNSHCSIYLENAAWSGSASVLKFHSDIAAEAVSKLIEGDYTTESKVISNYRTIQISVLTVTKQGD